MLKVGVLEGAVGECCVAERYVPEPGAAEVGVFDGSVVKGDVADCGTTRILSEMTEFVCILFVPEFVWFCASGSDA